MMMEIRHSILFSLLCAAFACAFPFSLSAQGEKEKFVLKTNLLVPLMNIGAGVPVGRNSSLEVDVSYPWLLRGSVNKILPPQKYCCQALAASAVYRYWIEGGHSVGVAASGGFYDMEASGRGQQGEFILAGFDYMYAIALGKGRFGMEFSAGIAFGGLHYENYDVPSEGGRLIGREGRQFRHILCPFRLGACIYVPIFGKRRPVAGEGALYE
ncbi:MAG: DUF3575 domain-containing protein [Bacteroidales bacterium]|nr:DUF3575 domain-containing protein [Bacteroidales bacterium]